MKVRFVKPEAGDPARDRGVRIPYAPARRNLARWRWYLILLVVASPFLAFVGKSLYSTVVVEAPGFISQEQVTVRTLSQGYVEEVYVHNFDAVAQGQPIARLKNDALSARSAQLRAEMQQLRSVRTQVPVRGYDPPPPAAFQDELQVAHQQRDLLGRRVATLTQLVAQGAATQAELDAARSEYDQAVSRMEELYRTMAAQTQPRVDGDGGATQMNFQIQTRVLALQTELANVQEQLQGMQILAPKAGRVVDLAVVKGDQLAIGSKVAMLAPEGADLHIDTYIPPKHADYAAPGMRATVLFPDGSQRAAMVTDVPRVATQVPRPQNPAFLGDTPMGVLVRMQFVDAPDAVRHPPLTDGLPVKVQFQSGWTVELPKPFQVQLRHFAQDFLDRFSRRRA